MRGPKSSNNIFLRSSYMRINILMSLHTVEIMETSKKYLAAAYMRLSVADDRITQSESISNQEYVIRHFVENHPDIEIVSERIDDGHSGLVFNRPSFTAMIQDAIEGKINCIIVKDLSRFGREYSETGRFLRKLLPAYGVRFISVID